eukprot:452738-Lingulodinium_polyedra.AAC.1
MKVRRQVEVRQQEFQCQLETQQGMQQEQQANCGRCLHLPSTRVRRLRQLGGLDRRAGARCPQ